VPRRRQGPLRDVLTARQTVIDYLYNFGDSWEHRLTVTDIPAGQPGVSYPRYVGGGRNAPPEDSRGMPGFYSMLDAVADPRHPNQPHIKEWLEGYDSQRHRPVADQDCPEPHRQSANRREVAPRPEQEKQDRIVTRRVLLCGRDQSRWWRTGP
jgi:Plasmid pRiA4b ORF-3-like protein